MPTGDITDETTRDLPAARPDPLGAGAAGADLAATAPQAGPNRVLGWVWRFHRRARAAAARWVASVPTPLIAAAAVPVVLAAFLFAAHLAPWRLARPVVVVTVRPSPSVQLVTPPPEHRRHRGGSRNVPGFEAPAPAAPLPVVPVPVPSQVAPAAPSSNPEPPSVAPSPTPTPTPSATPSPPSPQPTPSPSEPPATESGTPPDQGVTGGQGAQLAGTPLAAVS